VYLRIEFDLFGVLLGCTCVGRSMFCEKRCSSLYNNVFLLTSFFFQSMKLQILLYYFIISRN